MDQAAARAVALALQALTNTNARPDILAIARPAPPPTHVAAG
jgi:hypothetical protein